MRRHSIKQGMFTTGVLIVLLTFCASFVGHSQEAAADDDARLDWWRDARFGLFIHWGPVAQKGTEIGWSRGTQVPVEEYDSLYTRFNPTQFSATEWAQLARDAGTKYLVITSKHHDGFSLWDSEFTDYDMMATPYGRDILRPLSDACREEGLRFSTYYSIIDWYHPDYIPRGKGDNRPPETANYDRYVTFMKNQLRELITNYGPLGILWFDGEWEPTWTHEHGLDLYQYVRELQPSIITNNRVDKGRRGMKGVTEVGGFAGDYDTPEQEIGSFQRDRPWETCMTIGTQWAWKPGDVVKSFEECIRTLVLTCGGDGNLLLNVGPQPDGSIEARQAARLREMGDWLQRYGESIYGTRGGPFLPGEWGASTCKGYTIYVHVFQWDGDTFALPAIAPRVESAHILGGADVEFEQVDGGIKLRVDSAIQDPVDTVIVLTLDSPAFDIAPLSR